MFNVCIPLRNFTRSTSMTWWFVGGALLALVALGDAARLFSQLAINARPPNAEDKGPPAPPDEWFTQYLDHFNITDNRQWKQVNNELILSFMNIVVRSRSKNALILSLFHAFNYYI